MKQVKTLTNSFVLQEVDNNGNVLNELGFRKGGLSYLIKNNNVKFYLTEDYFYKNVVWSADIPLMVDGILYDINTLPIALKKIFETEGGGSEVIVDQELDITSTNAISNKAVTTAMLERYTKAQTNSLLQSYYTKMETNAMFANYAQVKDGDVISLNDENITIN